ncbi:MAG TPA: hypothetical protein VGF24_00270 [Vicinamibacterales bacterium]
MEKVREVQQFYVRTHLEFVARSDSLKPERLDEIGRWTDVIRKSRNVLHWDVVCARARESRSASCDRRSRGGHEAMTPVAISLQETKGPADMAGPFYPILLMILVGMAGFEPTTP